MMVQRVIVIGSNPATRLGLIRSVGAVEGCRVTVIEMVMQVTPNLRPSYDSASKYVDNTYFAEKFNAEGLCLLLLEKCRESNCIPLIMSVDDDSACLVDKIYDRLQGSFYYSHIDDKVGAIANLMDKQVQKEFAATSGFNIVKSWSVDIHEGQYTIPEEVSFPCYVKGRLSYHSAKKYQKRCNSRGELEEWLKVIAKGNPSPMLIEEYIEIEKEYGVAGYCNEERIVLPGIVELIESGHGVHTGVSAFGRVNDFSMNESLKEQVEHFIRNIRLSGQFNMDFVVSKGVWYFVELNMRFAAYGYAIFRAGVNLPAFQIYEVMSRDSSTLNVHVHKGYCYVNEKVAFDDVKYGFRTWRDYRNLLKKADCCLINQSNDKKPARLFKVRAIISLVKEEIKRIINNKE